MQTSTSIFYYYFLTQNVSPGLGLIINIILFFVAFFAVFIIITGNYFAMLSSPTTHHQSINQSINHLFVLNSTTSKRV